ncbi:Biotin-requiring enzyme [Bosea lathyri]|uniref:Biotin-requiring enzyme n=1 Tax=Bosea lathyri TaxID=1036778 RepID=A0A1H6DAC7_9HYPH|nr:Biotin-requiring enzyme [Bosea lathyri]
MKASNEVLVDIEKGKTLVIRCLAIGELDDKGMVTVFFELNGQPRHVKVPDRAHGMANVKLRRKVDQADAAQVGAPMPGVISQLAVSVGQVVRNGDLLVSIEAMKMETAIRAERDGTVSEVLVKVGDQVDAKDLLVCVG